jgi:hypothetical protein
LYGLPGPELIEAYQKGEVELGGCVIGNNDPEWRCKECGLAIAESDDGGNE